MIYSNYVLYGKHVQLSYCLINKCKLNAGAAKDTLIYITAITKMFTTIR